MDRKTGMSTLWNLFGSFLMEWQLLEGVLEKCGVKKLRDFDEYQKRKDQQRGGIGVFIGLLVLSGVLLFIGYLVRFSNVIGGKFVP